MFFSGDDLEADDEDSDAETVEATFHFETDNEEPEIDDASPPGLQGSDGAYLEPGSPQLGQGRSNRGW
jgi:hypothetical protein